MEKTFTDCLKPIIGRWGMPPNFTEKTLVDSFQTSKSTKVFSLGSFPARQKICHNKGRIQNLLLIRAGGEQQKGREQGRKEERETNS